MEWDCGFFISKNNLFQKQEVTTSEIISKNKVRRCSGCNQPLGVISTTLYEIDERQYCADCYSRMIIKEALDRDHSDLKEKKLALKTG
jgi:hypothetical protein